MKDLDGCTVSEVREMSEEEMEAEYWDADYLHAPPQIVLDNGARLFPSMDPEGNGTGWFVGLTEELVGATFLGARGLSKETAERLGWPETQHRLPVVLRFSHEISGFEDEEGLGQEVFPACDPEKNGPGAVFGRDEKSAFRFFPEEGDEEDGDEEESESSGDALDDLTDEILESETEIPHHHFFARLTRRTNGRYAVEISLTLQSGGHDDHWGPIGGSVGYDATVFDTEEEARTYFEDLQELDNDEMDEKYSDRGLWVTG